MKKKQTAPQHTPLPHVAHKAGAWALTIGALGVVYGDIGTSPLYAFRECIAKDNPHGVAVNLPNVLGLLSLFFWSLMLGISLKYAGFVMRADNDGQGGTLALMSLVAPRGGPSRRSTAVLLLTGLFGTALLAGDGFITPAISVLGAFEGLEVATHRLASWVVPLTLGVIVALFVIQQIGTGRIGAIFGPVMVVWFLVIAALGIPPILRNPAVLRAVYPGYAIAFFAHHGLKGFLILGSVVLCITGGEALYADMGHFGRSPIRRAWFLIAFPALLVNYFGQGALVLGSHDPDALRNPFYSLAPSWFLYPLVVIATLAAVIASQALISGMFSVVQQAIQLGYLPRVRVRHTARHEKGQIYVGFVNWVLMLGCLALVLAFRKSGNLAAAYGMAVTGTMAATSILFAVVTVRRFRWPIWRAAVVLVLFLAFDLAFFTANLPKFPDGGWFPLVVAALVLIIMTTWKRGREALGRYLAAVTLPTEVFLEDMRQNPVHRVRGTAVFMSSNPSGVPPVLLHHLKHNKVLHKQVVFLSVLSEDVPEVRGRDRVTVRDLGMGFYQVLARYGFMQTPYVPEIMERSEPYGLCTDPADTSYFLGRETLLTARGSAAGATSLAGIGPSGMSFWRKALFAFLSRNAPPITTYFGLPVNRVVEMGTQVEL